jgi:pimeloyl-ACP methyl ester carboxylesterase
MMNKKPKAFLLSFIILHSSFIILLSGCGARRTPDLTRIFERARTHKGKPPIIIIPGILGSQLRNRQTNEIVWPSAIRSSVDGLSLPATPNLENDRDDLVADGIVTSARLFPKLERFSPEVLVYRELLGALQNYGGYRPGNWETPAPDDYEDAYYVFAYDWRRDNVETARLFINKIEELKRKLGKPNLRFNIVAHSMGGLVARYAAAYGASDLPPEGVQPQPTWAGASDIAKIFMIGTPNEGSAEALVTLLEGYSVTEGLRRRVHLLNKLSREDAITEPAIFQLLPHDGAARFLDENLNEMKVDLYDPATWREYGWSPVNDPDFQRRYTEGRWRDEEARRKAGTLAELNSYFATVLRRARRFHDALDAAAPDATRPAVAFYAFGGDCEETLSAPVLLRDPKTKRWRTLTQPQSFRNSAGREWTSKEVEHAMYEPGDGRVTRRSLLGETHVPPRRSALFDSPYPLAYAIFACDLHSDLQKNKTLQDNALTLLLSEVMN